MIGYYQYEEIQCKIKELENEWKLSGYSFDKLKKLFETYAYYEEIHKAAPLALIIQTSHPEEYYLQYIYGNALLRKKKYGKAIREYRSLIEKLPHSSFLYLTLGEAYEMVDAWNEALSAYEMASTYGEDPRLQRAQARVLANLGRTDEAEEITAAIDSEVSGFLTKELSSAEVALLGGDYSKASDEYHQVLDSYGYNQDALWGLWRSAVNLNNSSDIDLSYRRWEEVHFPDTLREKLAQYMRPKVIDFDLDCFSNKTQFCVFSSGVGQSRYIVDNNRASAGYYYTRFYQDHYKIINRNSLFLPVGKSLL